MAVQTEISPPFSAPSCPQCGIQMLIVRISRDWPTYIQRTYQCPWCPRRTSEVVRSPMGNPPTEVIGASVIGLDAMSIETASQAKADEEILTFDIPDAVLERAGSAKQTAFTLFYCTSQSSECGLRD
jgi:hypothetical protein